MATLPQIVGASPLDADDASRLLFTVDTDLEVLTRTLGDTPSNFLSMDTLTYTMQWRTNLASIDDSIGLEMRVMNGATVLAAANSGGGWVTIKALNTTATTTDQVVGPTSFAYVNTSATKTQWDGASVELRQGYSRNMGADSVRMEVDYFALNGTYSVAPIVVSASTHAHSSTTSDVSKPYLFSELDQDIAAIAGPMAISGDLYVVGRVAATPTTLSVQRSTNGGSSWTEVAQTTLTNNHGILTWHALAFGGDIYIAVLDDGGASSRRAYVYRLDLPSFSWTVDDVGAVGGSWSNTLTSPSIRLGVRSSTQYSILFRAAIGATPIDRVYTKDGLWTNNVDGTGVERYFSHTYVQTLTQRELHTLRYSNTTGTTYGRLGETNSSSQGTTTFTGVTAEYTSPTWYVSLQSYEYVNATYSLPTTVHAMLHDTLDLYLLGLEEQDDSAGTLPNEFDDDVGTVSPTVSSGILQAGVLGDGSDIFAVWLDSSSGEVRWVKGTMGGSWGTPSSDATTGGAWTRFSMGYVATDTVGVVLSTGTGLTYQEFSVAGGAVQITPSASVHAHSSSTSSIAPTYNLVVDASVHAHSSTTSDVSLPAVTVTPADSTHAHSSGTASISVSYDVTPAASVHAHSSTVANIAVSYDVAGQNSVHDHSSTVASVAVSYDVGVSNSTHAHSSTTSAVVPTYNLVVNSSIHAHSSTQSAIDPTYNLVVSESVHLHSSTTVTVDTFTTVTPADSIHDHSSTIATVDVIYDVTPSSSVHEHSSTTSDVSVETAVTPADSIHGHSSSTSAIDPTYNLGVNGSTHSHSSTTAAVDPTYNLVVTDSTHAHSSTVSDVSVSTVEVSVASSVHGHSSTTVSIAVEYTVTPQDSVHGQVSTHAFDLSQTLANNPSFEIGISPWEEVELETTVAQLAAGDDRGVGENVAQIVRTTSAGSLNMLDATGPIIPGPTTVKARWLQRAESGTLQDIYISFRGDFLPRNVLAGTITNGWVVVEAETTLSASETLSQIRIGTNAGSVAVGTEYWFDAIVVQDDTVVVTPSNSVHVHSSTTAAITPTYNLVVSNSVHGHSSGTASVAVFYLVQPADSVHQTSSTVVAIGAIYNLTIQDSVHSTSTTTATIITVNFFYWDGSALRKVTVYQVWHDGALRPVTQVKYWIDNRLVDIL